MSIAAEYFTISKAQDQSQEPLINPVHTEVRLSPRNSLGEVIPVIVRVSKDEGKVVWDSPIKPEKAAYLMRAFERIISGLSGDHPSPLPQVTYTPGDSNGRFEVRTNAKNERPFGDPIAALFRLSQQGVSEHSVSALSERLSVAMRSDVRGVRKNVF